MSDISKIKVSGVEYNVKDSAALRDAPSDGKTYGRKNGAWSEVQGGGYKPPVGGIPKTDLASDVQTSLGKADTSVQPADLDVYALKSELADKQDKALIVSITQSGASYTADKTNAEIYAAWQSGREVIAELNNGTARIDCVDCDANNAYFALLLENTDIYYGAVVITTTGGTQSVNVSMTPIAQKSDLTNFYTKTETDNAIAAAIGDAIGGAY